MTPMPPTITPQSFVAKWRQTTLKERSASQEHFIDICHLVGHLTPAEQDPTGQFFTFEAGASKTTGGQGFADVWYKGHFAWEYKGKHADLDAAYQQLLKYREALENPPLLIVSDLDRIIIHTNYTNTVKRIYELALDDLLQPDRLTILHNAFYKPETFKAAQTTEQVTEQAAIQFAKLAHQLRAYGEDNQRIAHYLIRLLFCLFAEDVDLLPGKVFSNLVLQTRTRPPAFHAQLRQLFSAMSTGGWFGPLEIPYFDGHLFDDDLVLELDSDGLTALADVSGLDWGVIEPSIFGTLFERSLDPSKRAQLGAHYTSRDDILLIVEPVLMAPLRRRWEEVKAQALELVEKREQAERRTEQTKLTNQFASLLASFAQELAQVQVLDPACGSGNFLYIALRLLLDLWKEVSILASELGLPMMLPLPGFAPSPVQLHGIEKNPYAHQLAQATIWIGYIQWLRENGYGAPPEPILSRLDNIKEMDAILDEVNGVEPEWPAANVIIGNPPFLGDKKMRGELGDEYVKTLRCLYSERIPEGVDLVCYWFEKARTKMVKQGTGRAGLLATNSIRNGVNRKVLEQIKNTGNIFWAISDHEWLLDGAAVNVSIVGFDNGEEKQYWLDGKFVEQINSDLSSQTDLTQAKPLPENARLCFLGMMKGGPFDIDAETARKMLEAPLNPNGRPNSDVVRRRLGGQDITGRPGDTWIIDFGVNLTEQDAALYETPFEYIKHHVKPIRETNRRKRMATKWWLHGEPRPGLRLAIHSLDRCIVTPEVAKHRIFIWMDTSIIPDHTLHVIARDDDYFMGVLLSRLHEVWSLHTGSTLEDRPRYSSSRTFEAYPFPWPPEHEPAGDPRVEAIAQAARELVEKRDNWLNPPGAGEAELKKRTLTNLYNLRPTWLDMAHKKLDKTVFAAYGWPDGLGDDEILERLLALNLERAKS